MTWEPIQPLLGDRTRSGGVTVAWRKTSSRAGLMLVVTIAADVCEALGIDETTRLAVERDRLAGRLRARKTEAGGWKPQLKTWRGKRPCAALAVPLRDLSLSTVQPAQTVWWEIADGALVLRLPTWACPVIQVTPPPEPRTAQRARGAAA